VESDGDLAAAALLTEVNGIVEYHLAGTADAHVAASPSKLVVDFARSWARARGNRWLHLAGSLGPGDSLYQFKVGFSPDRRPVQTLRIVVDVNRYRELVGRCEQTDETADETGGFFPAYRKPGSPLD